jgi:hypothetical protein
VQLEIDVIQSDDFEAIAIETLAHVAHSHYRFRHVSILLVQSSSFSLPSFAVTRRKLKLEL